MNEKLQRLTLTLTLLAIIAFAPPAQAQTQIDQTRNASSDMELRVDGVIVGTVRVIGWDRAEMHVTGTIGEDVNELSIRGGPDEFEIEAEWDEDDWGDGRNGGDRRDGRREETRHVSVDLEIHVPRGAAIEMDGVTASFWIEGIDGDVAVETVTGDINYSGGASELALETVTGSITASGASVREGSFETVQGNIEFDGDVAADADLSFEAVGGNVTLTLPADVSAEFDIETLMGDISNEFGQEPRRTDRYMPSQELSFRNGSGSADISIETLQGTVTLRRR